MADEQVNVTMSWQNLITFCRDEMPEGEITFKVAAGQPTELIAAHRRVRFDKPRPKFTSDVLNHEGVGVRQ